MGKTRPRKNCPVPPVRQRRATPQKRWQQHAAEKPWWHEVARKTVEWHGTRKAAEAAEAEVVAQEKPAYDQTFRLWVDLSDAPPRLVFDYSADQARVTEAVIQKIRDGVYESGRSLTAPKIGAEYGVSQSIARDALDDISQRTELVQRPERGRYRVTSPISHTLRAGPCPEPR